MQPLKIKLLPKPDTDKQTFYIGKLKFPGNITLGKGALFSVYISDDISEIHITTPSDSDNRKQHNPTRKKSSSRHNNIAVDLTKQNESKMTPEGTTVYRGTISVTANVKADGGLVFLVFVADPGEEELQISMPEEKKHHRNKSEIIKKRRKIVRND